MQEYYDVIFKRRSTRKYAETGLSDSELKAVKETLTQLVPLDSSIKTKFVIKQRTMTKAKFGEYSLVAYSENKSNYLLNIGYLLQQFDLLLNRMGIGTCWYGLAKEDEQLDGLDFVIMIVFGKPLNDDLSIARDKINRKELNVIWRGSFDNDVTKAVSLAPSAVNSQPWRFMYERNTITVYRATDFATFIPASKRAFFNTIDVGISLCFLEIALDKKGYQFERRLLSDEITNGRELLAEYVLINK